MNRYWDALARAALDLPADAGPRPRSRFEPDVLSVAMDEPALVEVAARVDSYTPAPAPVADEAGARPIEVDAVPAEVRTGPDRTVETVTASDVALHFLGDSRVDAPQPLDSSDAPLAGQQAVVTDARPALIERTERVDLQRHETTVVHEIHAIPEPGLATSVAQLIDRDESKNLVEARERAEPAPIAAAAAHPFSDDATTAIAFPTTADLTAPIERREAPVQLAPLVIEIERIDIRLVPEQPPAPLIPASRRADSPDVPSLNDYLARRSGAPA
jgi:hypothetical protein